MKKVRIDKMKRLTKEDILSFPITSFGRSIGKRLASQVVHELLGYKQLEEQLGCPLDVVVKAFQKYIDWTTDCDFGYDNIPDEFEKYQNDKKFMNLKYNEGLMYIAIQETLEDIELEKNRR
jgi:hypothetical protein